MAGEAGLDAADPADGVAVAEGLYLKAIGSVNDEQG